MIRNRHLLLALDHGNLIVDALEELESRILGQVAYVGTNQIRHGVGSPEGVLAGTVGDLYLRQDGGTSTTLYVKTANAVTNLGWTAK